MDASAADILCSYPWMAAAEGPRPLSCQCNNRTGRDRTKAETVSGSRFPPPLPCFRLSTYIDKVRAEAPKAIVERNAHCWLQLIARGSESHREPRTLTRWRFRKSTCSASVSVFSIKIARGNFFSMPCGTISAVTLQSRACMESARPKAIRHFGTFSTARFWSPPTACRWFGWENSKAITRFDEFTDLI